MIEFIPALIIIIILGLLSFFYPTAKFLLIGNVIGLLRKNEAWIIQASYNSLPKAIKSKIDSKTFAEIVSNVLTFGIGAVEKDLTKK